jgi:quercetin dioxygenase-like cupin family protein
MPQHVTSPPVVAAAGTPPKTITEYAGRVATGSELMSVARMTAPPGWSEPAQTPEFTECTVVLDGVLLVEHDGGVLEVKAGEAVITHPGETIRYLTPEGASYVAVCVPAFGPDIVHRHE